MAHSANANYCLSKTSAGIEILDEGTALISAAANGHEETLKTLLTHGADVNLRDQCSRTALFCASANGHDSCVEILLSYGADIDAFCLTPGMTALQWAARAGDLTIVKTLLAHHPDVNKRSGWGETALDMVIGGGRYNAYEIGDLLLSHGAITDRRLLDKFNLISASQGYYSIVDALLTNGADPNITNSDGQFPLLLAAEFGQTAIVESLLSHGANVNKTTLWGHTALMLAESKGHLDIIKVLIANGADANSEK